MLDDCQDQEEVDMPSKDKNILSEQSCAAAVI